MILMLIIVFYLLLVGFITVLESKVIGLVQSSVSVFSNSLLGFYQFYLDFFKLLLNGILDSSFYNILNYNIFLILFLLNNLLIFLWIVLISCLSFLTPYDIMLVILMEGNNLIFKIYIFYLVYYNFVSYNELSLKSLMVFLESVYISLFLMLLILLVSLGGWLGYNKSLGLSSFFIIVIFFVVILVTLFKMFSTPFDFLETESELVNGISLEFYGYSFLVWSLIEYSSLVNSVLFISSLYLQITNSGLFFFIFVNTFLVLVTLFVSSVFVSFKIESSIFVLVNSYCLVNFIFFILILL